MWICLLRYTFTYSRVSSTHSTVTHMCLCHQAVQSDTGHEAVMSYGSEGNRRSGIAGLCVTDLSGLCKYRFIGLVRDECPANPANGLVGFSLQFS